MEKATALLSHLVPLIHVHDDRNYTRSVTIEYDNGLRDRVEVPWMRPDCNYIKNGVYESIFRNAKLGLSPVSATVRDCWVAGCSGGSNMTTCTPEGVVKETRFPR